MDYLNGLNDKQSLAVTTTQGYLRIIAGAGTGKTRVITHRIAYIIDSLQVKPYRILALTFTNKAAKEMKDRVERILNQEKTQATICTFHALCVRILKEDIEHLRYPKSFLILDSDDQKTILKGIYKQLNIDAKMVPYPAALSFISKQKTARLDPKECLEELRLLEVDLTHAQIYDLYETQKQQQYALDFDDLLIKVLELFEKFPTILQKWQQRYDYIHVDEFQDTNDIQFMIVKMISDRAKNLCVVGDADQTIYTWRGANTRLILDFDKLFDDVKTVTLEKNYRSTKSILKVANKLIAHNQLRIKKQLTTDNSQGQSITYITFMTPEQEAQHVAAQIATLVRSEQSQYKECAILYRANYLSRPFEQALINSQVPYRLYGGTKFFERKEVKDMLGYLRLVEFADDLSFLRIINTPRRGIGDKTLEQIQGISKQLDIPLLEAAKQMTFSTAVQTKINQLIDLIHTVSTMDVISEKLIYLLEHSGYADMLKLDEDSTRLDNVTELIQSVVNYENENTDSTTEDYLHEIALYTGGDEKSTGDYVSLLTIHAAKGLEFDQVFLVGFNQEDFPSQRAMEESSEQVEEERRLAYVAFTRARKQLCLTGNSGYHFMNQSYRSPSMFIDEALDPEEKPDFILRQAEPVFVAKKVVEAQTHGMTFQIHDVVEHPKYGEGVVVAFDDGLVEVAFGVEFGLKKMLANSKYLKNVKSA